jgi:hypothetical protein
LSLLLTVEHVYAATISDAKKVAKFIEASVLPALEKVQANASTVEAITALVSPQLANIERVGDAVLGVVIKAIEDAGSAAASGGVNVSLDAQIVADIKAIIPAVKASLAPASVAAVAKA